MKRIELDKIPQKSIREFVKDQMSNNIETLSDIKSTYTKGDDISQYLLHEEIYSLDSEPKDVWKHYMTANPAEVWKGKTLSFGFMVDKSDESLMYVGEKYNEAKVGQVFYINLFIFGLINVAVSHEIIEINHDKKYFELSYVHGSKSYGKQRIAFYETGDGSTRIVHTTYYKSDSNFRDKYIYPYFHTKVIDEYHQSMKNTL